MAFNRTKQVKKAGCHQVLQTVNKIYPRVLLIETVYVNFPVHWCMSYLIRAVFWEKHLCQSGAFGPQTTVFFQEAFRSSDLPQIPANNWTREVYAHTQKPTVNQQVQSIFPSCLLSVYTTNLQVLFKLCSFLQCSYRSHTYIHTHTFAGKTADVHASLNSFRYKTHHQHTHTFIHTVFLPTACCRQASHGPAGCDIITLRRLVLPTPTPHPPKSLPSPGAACQSVSVISDSMLD